VTMLRLDMEFPQWGANFMLPFPDDYQPPEEAAHEAASSRYVTAGGSISGGDASGSFTRDFRSAAFSINAAEILGS